MRVFLLVLLRVTLLVANSVCRPAAAGESDPVVLATTEEIPTAYLGEGGQTGFLVDLAREAFRRSGRSVKIVTVPWARGISFARSGETDGIMTLYRTPDRESYLDFSDEAVLVQDQAFYVRAGTGASFGPAIAGLADKRIGIMTKISYGAQFDALMRRGFFSHLDPQTTIETLVKMLVAGRVDVVPAFRGTMRRTARSLGLMDRIEELPLPMEALPSYVGFTRARDMSEVKRDFDSGLRSMKVDGGYGLLLKRYFPPDHEP
jgi:polar amino acid transport system substrate-binding protein